MERWRGGARGGGFATKEMRKIATPNISFRKKGARVGRDSEWAKAPQRQHLSSTVVNEGRFSAGMEGVLGAGRGKELDRDKNGSEGSSKRRDDICREKTPFSQRGGET